MSIIKKIFSNSHRNSLIIFNLIFLVIVFTNLVPHNKWFLGWDSINSELNNSLNIKRSLFASWQENYGLGTLGGHGFAAILPHSLITSFLSIFLSPNTIRPIFTFICYYLGGLGMYFLVKKLLSFISDNKFISYIALISSLFYLFNLATTLTFSVQLESFIVHFASLPWLFWIIIKLISSFSKKNIILFCLINFFASIQGFTPPLFIVYFIAILIFLFTYIIHHRFSPLTIKNSFLILFLTFIINAYWLLPFSYFSITRSNQTSQSYNNLVSTTDFIEKSEKYGTIENTMLLKGPYWDYYELGQYISKPLRDHHQNPLVPLIGYTFFILAIIGIITNFVKHKNYYFLGFTIIFIYFFSSINISTPPFSYLNKLIELISPIYHQAFRVPFTKFGIGTAFIVTILMGVGLLNLIQIKKNINFNRVIIGLFLSFIIFYNLPIFKGNFIFSKMYVNLPSAYLEIIDYFKSQPNGRIADMPQSCAEGWYGYKWDYFGSGFYWYGIKQPFLSRSFDVWNKNNENYYWEISQAFRRQDYNAIDQIFEKYNVDWILYDSNFLHCSEQKTFMNKDEFLNYFNQNPKYKLIKTFSEENILPIYLYQRASESDSFISISSNTPNIGPKYDYNDNDPVKTYPYISDDKNQYQQFFPFNNLFTKRSSKNKNFDINLTNNSIIFSTTLPPQLQNYKLDQNFLSDNYLPIILDIQKENSNNYQVLLNLETPIVTLDNNIISQKNDSIKLGEFKFSNSSPIEIVINHNPINFDNQPISNIFYLNSINTVQIINKNTGLEIFSWQENTIGSILTNINKSPIIIPNYKEGKLKIEVPIVKNSLISPQKIESPFNNTHPQLCNNITSSPAQNKYEISDSQDPKYIRLISQEVKQCLNLTINNISTNYSYLANIITRYQQGENLFLRVTNKNRPIGIDLYLQSSKTFNNEFFIIPSNIPDEIEYNFNFESKSFNKKTTINDINSLQLYLIPYNYFNNLKLIAPQISELQNNLNYQPKDVKHPNETFYKINLPIKTENKLIILYQSYSPEWLAFSKTNKFPFISPLKNHTTINNWGNAWELPNNIDPSTVYILFWPQILEFLGLGLIISSLIWVFKKK
ncbi:MAG: hypothetical protein PHX34_03085 [Candidatus Shapirobacteria bacterium]|nr:hypothetical protein [Candidatus Shapirobacteria bacterium]